MSPISRRLRLISFVLGCRLERTYLPWLLSLKYLLGRPRFSLLQCWLTSLPSFLKCRAVHLVPVSGCSTHTIGFGMLLLCLCLPRVRAVTVTAGEAPCGPSGVLQALCEPRQLPALPAVPFWRLLTSKVGLCTLFSPPRISLYTLMVRAFSFFMSSPGGQRTLLGQEAVSFFLVGGDTLQIDLISMPVLLSLSVGLTASALAPAHSPLLFSPCW